MSSKTGEDVVLRQLLAQLAAGDKSAIADVITHAHDRILRIIRKSLNGDTALQRWETDEDVFQNVAIRLCRTFADVQPSSERGFFGLVSLMVRREKADLYRRHFGPQGHATFHSSCRMETNSSHEKTLAYELMAAREGTPPEQVQDKELFAILDKLDPCEGAVFMLLYLGVHRNLWVTLDGTEERLSPE